MEIVGLIIEHLQNVQLIGERLRDALSGLSAFRFLSILQAAHAPRFLKDHRHPQPIYILSN